MAAPPPKQPPPIEEMEEADPPPWTEELESAADPDLDTTADTRACDKADTSASGVAIFVAEPSAAAVLRAPARPDDGEEEIPHGLGGGGPCDEAHRQRPSAEVESADPDLGTGVRAAPINAGQPAEPLALAACPEKLPHSFNGGLPSLDASVRAAPLPSGPPPVVGAIPHLVRPRKLPYGLGGGGGLEKCDSAVSVHQLAAMSAADAVLQPTKVSELLPAAIRVGFVKKVYGILSAMLLVTFGLTVPFVVETEMTYDFFAENVGILYVVFGLMLAMYVYHWCMLCATCCGIGCFMDAYLMMMKTAPWNYLYIFTFAGCFGVAVGFVCATYTAESVVLAFGVTALLVVALSVYAVKTQADFTGCGGYVVVLLLGLVCLTVIVALFPQSNLGSKVTAGVGAIVFGFIIVYDTQLIFGCISDNRTFEYTLDMYAFAAWNLYLDFINMFLYLLRFLGSRPS